MPSENNQTLKNNKPHKAAPWKKIPNQKNFPKATVITTITISAENKLVCFLNSLLIF